MQFRRQFNIITNKITYIATFQSTRTNKNKEAGVSPPQSVFREQSSRIKSTNRCMQRLTTWQVFVQKTESSVSAASRRHSIESYGHAVRFIKNPRHVRGFLYKTEQKFRPSGGTFVPPGFVRAAGSAHPLRSKAWFRSRFVQRPTRPHTGNSNTHTRLPFRISGSESADLRHTMVSA